MKILILGVNGMIGHKLFYSLSQTDADVWGTIRKSKEDFARIELMQSPKIIEQLKADEFCDVEKLIEETAPNVLINCIGITKRKEEMQDPIKAISINALMPHKLAQLCYDKGIRMIHFSTDCVFSGDSGSYNEDSIPNAEDMYGKTKGLGEPVSNTSCVTIRSSFIGRELCGKTELLEWFLSQAGKTVKGFTRAMYSGVSTTFMSKVVSEIILKHPDLWGLYQLAPEKPISKYDLLCLAKKAFALDIDILADNDFSSDKSLSGDKLKRAIGVRVPSWEEMFAELASEDLYNGC